MVKVDLLVETFRRVLVFNNSSPQKITVCSTDTSITLAYELFSTQVLIRLADIVSLWLYTIVVLRLTNFEILSLSYYFAPVRYNSVILVCKFSW